MADAKSNKATLEALDGARSIINGAINTVRDWQKNDNGTGFTASYKTMKLESVTDMDSAGVAAFLATAKEWDGTVTT